MTGRRVPDWLLFLGKFLRHGTAIASVAPSSRTLSRGMTRGVDFDKAGCVVELGAGTGPITAELVRHVRPGCRLLVVERDPDFCKLLRERYPDRDVVEADACDLDRLLKERGVGAVSHFFCGLPLPSFRLADRDKVLGVVRDRLAPDGTFRQITEMPWVYYRMYRRYFAEVRFHMIWRNLPPAGYYVCRRPQLTESGQR